MGTAFLSKALVSLATAGVVALSKRLGSLAKTTAELAVAASLLAGAAVNPPSAEAQQGTTGIITFAGPGVTGTINLDTNGMGANPGNASNVGDLSIPQLLDTIRATQGAYFKLTIIVDPSGSGKTPPVEPDCRPLPAIRPDWWSVLVVANLTEQQQRILRSRRSDSLESLDLAALLRVFNYDFDDLTQREELPRDLRTWLKEMQGIRNKYAHPSGESLPVDDQWRDLDTIQ